MEISAARHKLETIIKRANDIGDSHIPGLACELRDALDDDNHTHTNHHNDNYNLIPIYKHYDDPTICNPDNATRSSTVGT